MAMTRFQGTHSGGPNFAYELCAENGDAGAEIRPRPRPLGGGDSTAPSLCGATSRDPSPPRSERRGSRSARFVPLMAWPRPRSKLPLSARPRASLSVSSGRTISVWRRLVAGGGGRANRKTLVGCGSPETGTEFSSWIPKLSSPAVPTIGEIWLASRSWRKAIGVGQKRARSPFGARQRRRQKPVICEPATSGSSGKASSSSPAGSRT